MDGAETSKRIRICHVSAHDPRPGPVSTGFGTKLFFHCGRLSVASRAATDEPWLLLSVLRPYEDERHAFDPVELPETHDLHKALKDTQLLAGTATAILIEDVLFSDKNYLLSYERIVSYCDWFTVLGDVRSGLFHTRLQFHRAIHQSGRELDGLHTADVPIRPIQVLLQLNGEKRFTPLGERLLPEEKSFYGAWEEDTKEFHKSAPAIWMFGHRFADTHPGGVSKGGQRGNDRTALCLTDKTNWMTDDGYAIVAHVEGYRRQRETYPEAGLQNRAGSKKGVYSFDERFGLWLCRDFVPVTSRNDLLKRAIAEAEPRGWERDFKTLRNWKIFVNHQDFQPIANRGDVSNFANHESRIAEILVQLLRNAFKQSDFREWIEKIQSARRERERDDEIAQMRTRRDEIMQWANSRTKPKDALDLASVQLEPRNPKDTLRIREPKNEQEVFYLYAQLSARFEVPLFVLEYDAYEGVDAIGRVMVRGLLRSTESGYARIEFKRVLESGVAVGHYFDAIDVIICWEVQSTGPIDEAGAATIPGKLQERSKSVLTPPFDTHEILYEQHDGSSRIIPVLELKALFPSEVKTRKGSR